MKEVKFFGFISILTLFVLTMFGCEKDSLTMDQYQSFIADKKNGYLLEIESKGNVTIQLQYVPVELIFYSDLLEGEGEFSSKAQLLKSKYSLYKYFKLRISKGNRSLEEHFGGDPQRYGQLMHYLNSEIGQDLTLVINDKHHAVFQATYIPKYGLTPTTELLIIFKTEKPLSNLEGKVVLNEKIFGLGSIDFNYTIKRFPELTM